MSKRTDFGNPRRRTILGGLAALPIIGACSNAPASNGGAAADPINSSDWGISADSENDIPDFSGTTLTLLSHPTIVSAVYGNGTVTDEWEQLTGGSIDVVTADTNEVIQRATVEFMAGSGRFDIVQPETMDMHDAYRAGFEPLDDYIANAPAEWEYDDFLPGLRAHTKIDGVTYGIPLRWGLSFYFYRKDLFQEHNIQVPATLDDFDTAVRDAHRSLQGSDTYGIVQRGVAPEEICKDWLSFFYAAGGNFFEADGHECGLNTDAAVKAVELFRGWYQDGILQPDYFASSRDQTIGLFQQRRAAQTIMFSPWYGQLVNPENTLVEADELGWALHPADPGNEGVTRIGPRMTGITKDSRNKAAAWHFTMFVTNRANDARAAGEWANSPVRTSTIQGDYGQTFPIAQDWMRATERSRIEPPHKNMVQMLGVLGEGLVEIIDGQADTRSRLDAVCREVEGLM